MSALLAALPLAVSCALVGFSHVGAGHGVEVCRRDSSPAVDLVAEGEVNAPPAVVRSLLTDYANAKSLSDKLAESQVLWSGVDECIVYQRMRFPLVSERDVTLHARWGEEGGRQWVRFSADNARGPGERRGSVRLSTFSGEWELSPVQGGQATRLRYHLTFDLGGSVPRWMVSRQAALGLPQLFEDVRRESRRRVAASPSRTATR